MPPGETKRALIVVRTYPVPDESGVEASCTAAITDKGEWLRLFPVPWRLLPENQRFRKYQWVDLPVVKATGDPRPESHHLRQMASLLLPQSCQRPTRGKPGRTSFFRCEHTAFAA